jgi:hypothetical protein
MGPIKKILLLALIVYAIYFSYKYMFKPLIETGKERTKTFYRTVPEYNP